MITNEKSCPYKQREILKAFSRGTSFIYFEYLLLPNILNSCLFEKQVGPFRCKNAASQNDPTIVNNILQLVNTISCRI